MSALLWKAYLEDDFDTFRQLLASGAFAWPGAATANPHVTVTGSPGRPLLSVSPNAKAKSKPAGRPSPGKGRPSANNALTRAEVNSHDAHGVTLLHMAASSSEEEAEAYAGALLQNPLLDLYIQDHESGWTALHRALYAGNISTARALMARDMEDFTASGGGTHAGGLIKIKDREGNSPFDVYAMTVAPRDIPTEEQQALVEGTAADDDDQDAGQVNMDDGMGRESTLRDPGSIGDELFMFGSNKNITLGFGDEDDRHFPERIMLKRPDILLEKFLEDHQKRFPEHSLIGEAGDGDDELPAAIKFKPIHIQDIQLSKLHTAILTTDPQANLYMCGFGPGGRLGTGDQDTKFKFCSVLEGGLETKKIVSVGLGQDHTIAVTSEGEAFTWGSNKYGQLGYGVPTASKDEEPMQLTPKHLGALRRETVLGCAASRTHSVVFTSDALFTFGKNDGQLGLVDADARSIEKQVTPRKVAASILANRIKMASAIDKATVFLLENHEIWVFANYGYAKMSFPLNNPSSFIRSSFSAVSRHDGPNHIVKICGGGDTICALARTGEIFTTTVSQKVDSAESAAPKIRGVLSSPQRIWSLKKEHMSVRDVDVGQDGSVIICTKSGSVWRRVKRAKIKDSNAIAGATEYKAKDYKFSRIPGLTQISAVRANAFGAFSAIRNDCDALKTQVQVPSSSLWQDIFPLLSFKDLPTSSEALKSLKVPQLADELSTVDRVRQAVLMSKNIESDLATLLSNCSGESAYDINIGSTTSEIRIPAHQFLLMARSLQLCKMIVNLEETELTQENDVCYLEYDAGRMLLLFKDADLFSVLNAMFYAYTDNVLAVWNLGRQSQQNGVRYRKVRLEVMKIATSLGMPELERAARLMTNPAMTMNRDLDRVIEMPDFFAAGDMEIELEDAKMKLHSALACQRCPFFEGMFHGRAGGFWLDSRVQDSTNAEKTIAVDLEHISQASFIIFTRYLYSDVEDELFAHCVTPDLDEFMDIVLDVLAIANELMVDRLAHICQRVLGRYVTTRNVCWLLNAVAPCSVTRFKTAALEYICMNLEGMLENRLLDELDEDLIVELGDAVRENQLAYMPFSRSGRAEAELYEQYPELAELSERSKQTKVDYMTLQSHLQEDEVKMAKLGRSPALKAKHSTVDLMFDMDDDGMELSGPHRRDSSRKMASSSRQSSEHWPASPPSSLPHEEMWYDAKGKAISGEPARGGSPLGDSVRSKRGEGSHSRSTGRTPPRPSRDSASPWATPLQTSKLDMREIMSQANDKGTSNLASALSSKASVAQDKSPSFGKLSQKERKKAVQAQKVAETAEHTTPSKKSTSASPWRTPSGTAPVSLKDQLFKSAAIAEALPSPTRASASPGLTMRQTVAGNTVSAKQKGGRGTATTPETARQGTPAKPAAGPKSSRSSAGPSQRSSGAGVRVVPQSVRHATPAAAAESSVQLSLAEILAQQQTEKDVIKEATAKRSLQEIQQEQEFQEWWDQEEAATKARMEQEAAAQRSRGGRRSRGGQHGRGKGRSKAGDGDDEQLEGDGGSRGAGRSAPARQAAPAAETSSSTRP